MSMQNARLLPGGKVIHAVTKNRFNGTVALCAWDLPVWNSDERTDDPVTCKRCIAKLAKEPSS